MRHDAGVAMIVIVEPTCEMPDAEVRDIMARDMKRHDAWDYRSI